MPSRKIQARTKVTRRKSEVLSATKEPKTKKAPKSKSVEDATDQKKRISKPKAVETPIDEADKKGKDSKKDKDSPTKPEDNTECKQLIDALNGLGRGVPIRQDELIKLLKENKSDLDALKVNMNKILVENKQLKERVSALEKSQKGKG